MEAMILEDFKKSIHKKLNDDEAFFINIIGTNGSGKTFFLDNIYEQYVKKNEQSSADCHALYFPAEIVIEDETKKGTEKKPSLVQQLINLISASHGKFKYKISNKNSSKLNNIRDIINDCCGVNSEDDKYFKKDFSKMFSYIEDKYESDYLLIKKLDPKMQYSSGEGFYTFLKIAKNILSHRDNNFKKKKIIFILDEPEKFLHPTLIKKITSILLDLFNAEHINIILSTHSPCFLKFVMENSVFIKKNIFMYKFQRDDKTTKISSIPLLEKQQLNRNEPSKKINSRLMNNICETLFCENIFLVEGLRDYEFIKIILNEKFPENYSYVIDCEGKENIKKLFLEINHRLKFNECFVFVDEDKNEKWSKFLDDPPYKYYYKFKKNIEEEIGIISKDKKDLSDVIYEKIEKMTNFDKILSKLKEYIDR